MITPKDFLSYVSPWGFCAY